jgi:hypothetical protein
LDDGEVSKIFDIASLGETIHDSLTACFAKDREKDESRLHFEENGHGTGTVLWWVMSVG